MAYLGDTALFLREFARDPLHTAAVAPARRRWPPRWWRRSLRAPWWWSWARAPGRSPARCRSGTPHGTWPWSSTRWAARLAERCPAVDGAPADAATLPALLAEHGIGAVDAVVSGLPWVAYASGGLHRVIADTLAPTGVFTQFAYSATRWAPPARRQLVDLRRHFVEVTTTPVVWRNLPPAVVHRARMPLPG